LLNKENPVQYERKTMYSKNIFIRRVPGRGDVGKTNQTNKQQLLKKNYQVMHLCTSVCQNVWLPFAVTLT
jgi:hypothetical protein